MSSKNVDRFSMLPEDVLSHILSLMPIIFAVRTSILSKRWRYRWMFVTNIDFDDNYVDLFTDRVDQVLELCKTLHLNLFRLRLHKFSPHEVYKWIEKVVRLNVHELDLEVGVLQLPLSLFTCKTLTKLRLDCTTYYSNFCEFQVNLPCLKTLYIVGLANSHVSASKLISGCPTLESLSFQATWHDEEDYIFNTPTLKRLEVTWLGSVRHNHKVVLNVPNLEYLFVGGGPGSIFVVEDVTSLVKASISIHGIGYSHLWWTDILNGLSGVKSLSVEIKPNINFRPLNYPDFPYMKHLELKSCRDSFLILQLLENSPQLEHLYIEKLEDSCLISPKRVPVCMVTKLTTMKLSNCNGRKWEIEFLEYMLGNAEVLKTLTVTLKNVRFVKEMRLRAQLLAVPRASRYCKIHFLESGSPSTLVKWTGQCVDLLFNTINHVC